METKLESAKQVREGLEKEHRRKLRLLREMEREKLSAAEESKRFYIEQNGESKLHSLVKKDM